MRMWKTNPVKLCQKHLGGEHAEIHMFVGCLNKGRSIRGYIEDGLVEVHYIKQRHDELAAELLRRKTQKYPNIAHTHKSPLPEFKAYEAGFININTNIEELKRRCPECKKNFSR